MDQLRSQLGFSLLELETALFEYMARQFAGLMAWALERIDDWLSNERDSRRFRMRDKEPRTLQTLFGVDITFRRRRYVDRETGKTVRSEEHTSELQSRENLVCRLLLEK